MGERDQIIKSIVQEIKPTLLREAKKIKRPVFIDEEDLVQEALINIVSNLDSFDDEISSMKTWCVNIAKHKFYNVAKDYYRKKRSPKNANNENIFHEVFDENCCDALIENYNPIDVIHEKELITETEKRIHNELSKKIFNIMLEPSHELIELVNDRDNKQKSRVKKVNENEKTRSKEPNAFHISNDDLASFFGVKPTAIIRAKDKIRSALRHAINVCNGNV